MIQVHSAFLLIGLSTDTKPTDSTVLPKTGFYETDTHKMFTYKWDEGTSTLKWGDDSISVNTYMKDITMGEVGKPGLLSIDASSIGGDVLYDINEVLSLLAPTKPQSITAITGVFDPSTITFDANDLTGTTVKCTTNRRPVVVYTKFARTLETVKAYFNNINNGQIIVTSAPAIGSDGFLNITYDGDAYVGIEGKSGFWKALSANITPTVDFDFARFAMKLSVGALYSPETSVDVIELGLVNVSQSGKTLGTTIGNAKFVSGVPCIGVQTLPINGIIISNIVRKHYNKDIVYSVSSPSITTVSKKLSGIVTENQTISVSENITFKTGMAVDAPSFLITAFHPNGTSATANVVFPVRVDSLSNETARKTAGLGQYPSGGYGSAFDSAVNISAGEELQLSLGKYQHPTGDFSGNLVSGPNYNTAPSKTRYAITTAPTTVSGISGFTITLNGSENLVGIETVGLIVQAKVEGMTGWIDCNKAYSLIGNPSSNGDPAMVYANSTESVKRCTFGTGVLSGQLYVRVGVVAGSNIKFTGVTVSV